MDFVVDVVLALVCSAFLVNLKPMIDKARRQFLTAANRRKGKESNKTNKLMTPF